MGDGGETFLVFFLGSCESSKENIAMGMWMCAPRAIANWTGDRIRNENKQNVQYVGVSEG